MSTEEKKALLFRYVQEVWQKGDPTAVENFLAPTYRRHRSPTLPSLTFEQQKQLLLDFRAAFPDGRLTIEEVMAEGDKIAFRSTMRGTHKGEFLGTAPTGRKVMVSLLDVIRIEDGRFVEQWGGPDIYDLVRQLTAD